MSSKYPYLDIAISVLADGNQPVNYSFNSAPTIALPSLSSLARHFVNLSDGYVMWQVGGRRAFTYFRIDEESATTVLAITVRLDPDILLSGRPIVNLLGTIRRTLTDGNRLTHESLMSALADSGFPENPLRTGDTAYFPETAKGLCCRTYISSSELSNIMAFPRQKEYLPYQGVIIVPVTVSMQPDSSIPMITEPLDKALMVVCPENVTASASRVELSDHLSVTYTLEGFDSQTVEFEVGTTNRYVRINGPALVVNSALHAGITFTRSVPFSVESSNGNKIETFTILVNDRTAPRTNGAFEITNNDFHNGKITISVSSTNFGVYTHEFTPVELSEATPLKVVLEPDARKICLRLDFGNGRIIEDSISLEKNTPEYNRLRAGSFHGFRAHRMMGSSPETYSIDLRQTASAPHPPIASTPAAAPTAPTLPLTINDVAQATAPLTVAQTVKASVSTGQKEESPQTPETPAMEKAPAAVWETRQHKRVAPRFENITSSNKQDNELPETQSVNADLNGADSENQESGSGKKKSEMRLIVIGITVIALALIVWWLMLLFSGKEDVRTEITPPAKESIEEADTGIAEPQQVTASESTAGAPTATTAANEKSDIEYLNTKRIWKLDELKSDRYRALFAAMQNGDIQAMASHPYFATPNTATNKRAIQMIDLLWSVKGTFQEKSNLERLKKQTKEGEANLGTIVDDISRYIPADTNKDPRPGTK